MREMLKKLKNEFTDKKTWNTFIILILIGLVMAIITGGQ